MIKQFLVFIGVISSTSSFADCFNEVTKECSIKGPQINEVQLNLLDNQKYNKVRLLLEKFTKTESNEEKLQILLKINKINPRLIESLDTDPTEFSCSRLTR